MRILALLAVFLGSIAYAEVPLSELIQSLGEKETEKEKAVLTCHFLEDSVLEQVDKTGKVEGRLSRSYEVVRQGSTVISRRMVSQQEEGAMASQLKAELEAPLLKEGVKLGPSPFHPRVQAGYLFESAPGAGDGLRVVRFTPRKASGQVMKGQSVVDTRTGKEISRTLSPSILPPHVKSLQVDLLDVTDTPCEWQSMRVDLSGSGGLLFYGYRYYLNTNHRAFKKADVPTTPTDPR